MYALVYALKPHL